MDPGFHRGDDNAGKDGIGVDLQSTNSEPLGLEPRVVRFFDPDAFSEANDVPQRADHVLRKRGRLNAMFVESHHCAAADVA